MFCCLIVNNCSVATAKSTIYNGQGLQEVTIVTTIATHLATTYCMARGRAVLRVLVGRRTLLVNRMTITALYCKSDYFFCVTNFVVVIVYTRVEEYAE